MKKASIFVDVQNIYYTTKQNYGQNFDYNKFWARVTQEREIVTAIAYATSRGDKKQIDFQNILRAIGLGKGPKNYLIAVGYSGWNPGQLDKELSENAWIETPSDQNILFNTPAKDQVDALSKKVGFDLRMVSPDFGNA